MVPSYSFASASLQARPRDRHLRLLQEPVQRAAGPSDRPLNSQPPREEPAAAAAAATVRAHSPRGDAPSGRGGRRASPRARGESSAAAARARPAQE